MQYWVILLCARRFYIHSMYINVQYVRVGCLISFYFSISNVVKWILIYNIWALSYNFINISAFCIYIQVDKFFINLSFTALQLISYIQYKNHIYENGAFSGVKNLIRYLMTETVHWWGKSLWPIMSPSKMQQNLANIWL